MKEAILIVDDEAILLLSMRQELKLRYGTRFIYETALNAEQGFDAIRRLVADEVTVVLVISDWLMPGMKGDEFLTLVHQRYPQVKLVMMSGHADDRQMQELINTVQLCAFLRKPYGAKNLFKILESALAE
jgi:DNA-binding NtrC family response regulator